MYAYADVNAYLLVSTRCFTIEESALLLGFALGLPLLHLELSVRDYRHATARH
jgi:hypothetical protein